MYRKSEHSPEFAKIIRREISLFKFLDHPHILRLYEVLEDEHKVYLVFEQLCGVSLFIHTMDHGSLSEAETAAIAS